MRVRAPILVTTDPRDDLGRATAHVRVGPDGALTLLDELDLLVSSAWRGYVGDAKGIAASWCV
jgi:hypothetical protein